jgi:tight adherence protein C
MSAASVLAVLWAALAIAWCARHRPAPARVRALRHAREATAQPPPQAAPTSPLVRLGLLVHRIGTAASGRAPPAIPVAHADARRLGGAVAVGAALVPVVPLAAVPAAVVAWTLPSVQRARVARRRAESMEAELPEVVDLLVLAVDAGLTVPLALDAVARRSDSELGREIGRVLAAVALGRRLADALDDLPARASEAVRPLVAALTASERYGAPLSVGLGRLAGEVRLDRRRRAEEAARRVPVKLLFPLVTCTLPAFALLTVAPLIASALGSLRL